MTDKHITVDSIRWRSVLPWLHLLRAAQLALRIRVASLALGAVVVFALGQMVICQLPFHTLHESGLSWVGALNSMSFDPEYGSDVSRGLSLDPRRRGNSFEWLVSPWVAVARPAYRLFIVRSGGWTDLATGWTEFLWGLVLWGVLGGAISRMHAIRFARDESFSPIKAVRFAGRMWQGYVYAPLLPFLGIGLLALAGMFVARLDAWVAAGQGGLFVLLGWLPILAGMAMAVLLILVAVSWPLMVAAISAEGSDGFDGLSRAFGYVMNRPWYLLFLITIAFGVGLLTDYLVHALFGLTFQLAEWSTGVRNDDGLDVWRDFLKLLHLAVLVSYFWSATTVIYFLLRQSDDGTPLDQVYIPGPPPKPESLPLVGVAASQQPVIERPVTEAGETKA